MEKKTKLMVNLGASSGGGGGGSSTGTKLYKHHISIPNYTFVLDIIDTKSTVYTYTELNKLAIENVVRITFNGDDSGGQTFVVLRKNPGNPAVTYINSSGTLKNVSIPSNQNVNDTITEL